MPPANVAEELDVTDVMVELALANDDEELRRVTAHNLERWAYAVRTRLYIVAGGTNVEEDELHFVIPDVKAPNMLTFAQAISRRLDTRSDIQQPTPNRNSAIVIVDEGNATGQDNDDD